MRAVTPLPLDLRSEGQRGSGRQCERHADVGGSSPRLVRRGVVIAVLVAGAVGLVRRDAVGVVGRERQPDFRRRREAVACIDANSEAVVAVNGIAVDDAAAAVRREVQSIVAVAHRQRGIGQYASRAEQCIADRLPVRAVERLDAVRCMARRAGRVREDSGGAAERGIRIGAAEAASARRHVTMNAPCALRRKELNDAGHGVRAIEHARGTAHDLDAIEVVGAERREIERAAGVVHGDAVDEHLGELALAAADEERRDAAVGARLHHGEPRHLAQRVAHGRDPLRAQLRTRDHGDRRGRALRCQRRTGRGDDDGCDTGGVPGTLRERTDGKEGEGQRQSDVHGVR